MGVWYVQATKARLRVGTDETDLGHWQKDAEMFKSVKKAKWEDVILDADKKKAIQDDAMRFFTGQDKYKKLNVPWKRGVIVSILQCLETRTLS